MKKPHLCTALSSSSLVFLYSKGIKKKGKSQVLGVWSILVQEVEKSKYGVGNRVIIHSGERRESLFITVWFRQNFQSFLVSPLAEQFLETNFKYNGS